MAFGDPWSAANNNTYNRDNVNQLWPFTTAGDLAYATSATGLARLGIGAAGEVLTTNSGATAPEWAVAVGGTDYILIVDEKSSGSAGGTFTTGAWRTRDLNTEKADTGNHAAVASNQITLEAGTYKATILCPAFQVNLHTTRLQNITDASVIITGTPNMSLSGSQVENHSFIYGRFTLAAQKVLEVQHRCTQTVASTGFGNAASLQVETYTVVELLREAD